MKRKRLILRRETLRILAGGELDAAIGGTHPSSFPQCAVRSELSERETVGPCPGQYSFTCTTG